MERLRRRLNPPDGPGRLPDGERGDIVLGWLSKLVVTISILGLLGFDGIALTMNRFQAEDRAGTAARAAVDNHGNTKDVQKAYDAAVAAVDDSERDWIDPESFTIGADGSITLTLRRETATFVVEKIGPISDWATATATRTARPAR